MLLFWFGFFFFSSTNELSKHVKTVISCQETQKVVSEILQGFYSAAVLVRIGLGVLFRTKVLCNAGQVTEVPLFFHDYNFCFVLKLKVMVVSE